VLAAWEDWLRDGDLCDVDRLTLRAGMLFETDNQHQRVRAAVPTHHVLVDEAQDFSTQELRLVRRLVANPDGPNRVFLVGDLNQKVFAKQHAPKRAGFELTGQSRTLTRNYRNTRQILAAAYRLVEEYPALADESVEVLAPELSQYEGGRPVAFACRPVTHPAEVMDIVGHCAGRRVAVVSENDGFLARVRAEAGRRGVRCYELYRVEDLDLWRNPNDVETLAWHAELALRDSDEPTGRETAGRLWAATAGSEPTALARVAQFSLGHAWDYSEPRFNGIDWDAGLLGRLEGGWYDRDEPLAHALVRRAFAEGHWNADLVQTVRELCHGWEDHGLSNDVMPASGWVWVAHEEAPAGHNYYRAWERAFEAARLLGEPGVATLAVPYLVLGGVLRRCTGNYAAWLSHLQESSTTPGTRRAAARVVAALRNVEILPTPARVILANLAIEFADELASVPEGDPNEVRALADGLLDIDRQEQHAIGYLSERVWERVSPRTRELILQTIGVYRSFRESSGDRRDYGLVFVPLANAIVHEVEEQFSVALRLRGMRYFRRMRCDKSPGTLRHLLNDLVRAESPDARRDARLLRERGIRLDALAAFAPDLEGLAPVRNAGAHAGMRIDRDGAAVVFGDWFEKGRVRRLFETMLPP